MQHDNPRRYGSLLLTLVLAAVLSLCCKPAAGQDYIAYQQAFNRIDQDLRQQQIDVALQRLDSIGELYRFVFARHCFKALQIACVAGDTLRAAYWLERCFVQGVPRWVVRLNDITKSFCAAPPLQPIMLRYDTLRGVYQSHIDQPLAHTIDTLMARDYHYTMRVNDGPFLLRKTLYGLQWLRHNVWTFHQLKTIIEQHGYPGEKLIGLPALIDDSAKSARFVLQNGAGLELQDRRVMFMLLHYYSTRRRSPIMAQLQACVRRGELPAWQCGLICDFAALRSSRRHPNAVQYYVRRHTPDVPLDVLNAHREDIGLNTYEEQEENAELELAQWKTHRVNSSIILE